MTSMKTPVDKIPQFSCVASGIAHGKRSSSRAELSAVVFTVILVNRQLPDKRLETFTDAQCICNVLCAIENQDKIPLHHKMANYDLISNLADLWDSSKHRIFKVKAHRKFEEATDEEDLWTIIGNHWADQAAAAAILKVNSESTQTAENAVSFEQKEGFNLRCVLRYLIDLNIQQMKFNQNQPKEQPSRVAQSGWKRRWRSMSKQFIVLRNCQAKTQQLESG